MAVFREIHRRAPQIAPQVVAACLVAYFAYHAIQGEGGVLAYMHTQSALEKARVVRAELTDQRRALEHRVELLRPESLDRDLLAERARKVLNFGHPNDVVVRTPDLARPDARR